MSIQRILAIETSCDDTSVAIVRGDGEVQALCSASQDLKHSPFGGIVPEIASRAHAETLLPLILETLRRAEVDWSRIGAIAVTNRPGLVGSLMVGVMTAKALALARSLPLVGVNHLEGHILAPFLRDSDYRPREDFVGQFVALAISGGHTSLYRVHSFGRYEVIGATLDDAAGEAFDKFGKMLGLGFPGGVHVDRLAQEGDSEAFILPRSLLKEDSLAMSFSGLKAAASRLVQSMSAEEVAERKPDLCASFQQAIVDVLLAKLQRAVATTGIRRVILTGGVSANSGLRRAVEDWTQREGIPLFVPPLRYCTDNAAMIGLVGIRKLEQADLTKLAEIQDLQLSPSARSLPGDFH